VLNARGVLATVATAGFWPVFACAAEFPSLADSEPHGQRAPIQSSTGVRADARSSGLKLGRYSLAFVPPPGAPDIHPVSEPAYSAHDGWRYGYERATGESRLDEYRYGLAPRSDSVYARSFAPSAVPPRAGWGWSGRLGPLRWLGDAEGDLQLRVGGRLPGQPQTSGLGSIHVAFHYTFE